MPRFNPVEVPGYVEAVLDERLARDACFLGLTESVLGYQLRLMTLRDFMVIRLHPQMHKLLAADSLPEPVDVATFLWFLSPAYKPDNPRARRRYLKRCRSFTPDTMPLLHTARAMRRWRQQKEAAFAVLAQVIVACRAYVARTLQDRPILTSTGYVPSYYADICFWLSQIARHHHQRYADTLNMPLRQLFQFIREIKEHNGVSSAEFSNPSDRLMAAYFGRSQGN